MKFPSTTALKAELCAREQNLAARRTLVRVRVRHVGRRLHAQLGTGGLLASGFVAGAVFDRLRPTSAYIRSGSALATSVLRLSPLMSVLGEQSRYWFGE